MKILEMQSARLTNFEVLQRVKEYEAEHNGTDGTNRKRDMPDNLKRVVKDVKLHLEAKSAPLHPKNGPKYKDEVIQTLMSRLDEKYAFLPSEYIMIFNLRPKSNAELNTVVEDMGNRFKEQQQEDILEIIREVLGEDDEEMVTAEAEARADAREMGLEGEE